jgi:hypothetical protein
MKTELEEAAENHSNQTIRDDSEKSFIEGAKWQAKRMYSEKEVEHILFRYAEEEHAWFSCKSEINSFNEWFEQFKKK